MKTLRLLILFFTLFLNVDIGICQMLGKKIPDKVLKEIDTYAQTKCEGDDIIKEKIIEREKNAYKEILEANFDTPFDIQIKISKTARAKFPSYEERKTFITEQNEAYRTILLTIKNFKEEERIRIKEINDKFYSDDYVKQMNYIESWYTIVSGNLKQYSIPVEEYKKIENIVVNNSNGDAESAVSVLIEEMSAYNRIKTISSTGRLTKKEVNDIKEEAKKLYPNSFVDRDKYIKKQILELSSSLVPENFKNIAQNALKSIFFFEVSSPKLLTGLGVKSGLGADEDKKTISALLVEIDGNVMVIAQHKALPDKLPIRLTNAIGQITCSKMVVSKTRNIIGFIPDTIPDGMKPLKISTCPIKENKDFIVLHCSVFANACAEAEILSTVSGGLYSFSYKYRNRLVNLVTNELYKITSVSRNNANAITEERIDRTTPIIFNEKGEIVAYAIDDILDENSFMVEVMLRSSALGSAASTGKIGESIRLFHSSLETFVARENKISRQNYVVSFLSIGELKEWEAFNYKKYIEENNVIRVLTERLYAGAVWQQANNFKISKSLGDFARIAARLSSRIEKKGYQESLVNGKMFEESYKEYYLKCCMELKNIVNAKSTVNVFGKYYFNRIYLEYLFDYAKYIYDRAFEKYSNNRQITSILHGDLLEKYNKARRR